MKKTEIYTYSREELNKNKVIISENEINGIKYITEKNLGPIHLPNTSTQIGVIKYTNDFVLNKDLSFNTSIGTILTTKGTIVFNLNYVLKFLDSRPLENSVLITKPTFVSGEYLSFKDLEITVQILQESGERVLILEYY